MGSATCSLTTGSVLSQNECEPPGLSKKKRSYYATCNFPEHYSNYTETAHSSMQGGTSESPLQYSMQTNLEDAAERVTAVNWPAYPATNTATHPR